MPWDIKINPETRDWVFSGNHDLAITDGTDLINQRILTRLTIQRGSFLYDADGDFGSNLKSALSQPTLESQKTVAEQLIREALLPMEDISIVDITVEHLFIDKGSEQLKLSAIVQWSPAIVGSGASNPLPVTDITSVPIAF